MASKYAGRALFALAKNIVAWAPGPCSPPRAGGPCYGKGCISRLVATILTFTAYKPKTHDIEGLYRRVCNLSSDYFPAFPQETPKEIRRFELLKRAYIDARYKRDQKITKAELTYLVSRVQKLQTLTKKICRKEIRRLGEADS